MKNYYPEKPVVAYKRTTITMEQLAGLIQKHTDVQAEVKRSAFIIFEIESNEGRSGINNNYMGMQADARRWPGKYDDLISGVVKLKENGTGKLRLFCALTDPDACVTFLLDRLKDRGIYVGGTTNYITHATVETPKELAITYKREWVTGLSDYNPPDSFIDYFTARYEYAKALFV